MNNKERTWKTKSRPRSARIGWRSRKPSSPLRAELTAELTDIKQKIGDAKGDAFIGRPKIPNWEWSALLGRESAIKSEISRIEVELVRANREASERRWQVEASAQGIVVAIVKRAVALCDDDSDANWRRLEDALDLLRDKCPEYAEMHGLT